MTKGIKHDGMDGTGQAKLRYDLIPVRPLADLAEVYTVGCKTYGDNNWRNGIKWSRILAAMFRHLEAFRGGELKDKESGCYHLASVAWGAFALLEYTRTHPDLDDRVLTKPFDDEEANAELLEAARKVALMMADQFADTLREELKDGY